MKEVTVGVSQEWLADGQVLAYTISYLSVAIMRPWAAAVMQALDAWPKDRPFLVLHDLSREDVAIPYLLMNGHNVFNLGVTSIGNERIEAIARDNPHFRARLAVVISDTFSGKIVKNRARPPEKHNPRLEYKLFFSRETALTWLTQMLAEPESDARSAAKSARKSTQEIVVVSPTLQAAEVAAPPTRTGPMPDRAAETNDRGHIQAAVTCPKCGKVYRPGELACLGCGTVFCTGGETQQIKDGEEPSLVRWSKGEAMVAEQKPVRFLVGDTELALPVADSLVVGRVSPVVGDPRPDIDLSPFDAETKGVSRLHLRLVRKSSLIYIADLGSSNGSFLNGRRLFPNTEQIMRSGDELRLGHLKIKIKF